MTGWPLLLPHDDIRRILNRNTSRLVLTRRVKPGEYQVQDAGLERRNAAHRREGRSWLRHENEVLSIVITAIDKLALGDIDIGIARAAGFKTQRDFFDDWLRRRHAIELELPVHVCHFGMAETLRYLDKRPHRGYTTNPAQAVFEEGHAIEALDAVDLQRYADTAAWRDHMRKQQEQEAKSRAERVRELERAAAQGDREAQRSLFVIDQKIRLAEGKRPRPEAAA